MAMLTRSTLHAPRSKESFGFEVRSSETDRLIAPASCLPAALCHRPVGLRAGRSVFVFIVVRFALGLAECLEALAGEFYDG